MILLIDADILLFRMSFSHERTIDWGDGITSTVTDPEQAKARLERMIRRMKKFCHCKDSLLCFTHRKNFRYSIYPDYKANRKFERMEITPILREWMEETFEFKRIEMLEADDVMGVMATQYPDKYVIATIDKDLLQIPGRHYNWDSRKRWIISEETADRNFYNQILTGDATDNYFGVPGIGPVKAKKILDDNPMDDWWTAIVEAYENKDLNEEYALQMARVARILRVTDYNFESNEPILWTPKTNVEETHVKC